MSRILKVTRLNTYASGGAALNVLRLHKAIRKKNVDDYLLIAQGKSDEATEIVDEDSSLHPKSKLGLFLVKVIRRLHLWPDVERYRNKLEILKRKTSSVFYTLPISNYKELPLHPKIKEADIINVHWIGNFVDYPSFFKSINQPIVMTLHDENAGRGCLHYKIDNEQWKDIDNKFAVMKKEALTGCNIHIVAQSQQMKDFCLNNDNLKRFPISVIHNGVDTDKFVPIPKDAARKSLDIPNENLVFAFSSVILEDERKGLSLLIKALESMNRHDITLLCIGNYSKIINSKIDIRLYGFISNEQLMSIIYSAASFYVLPSFYESFAKTPLEAMSCGTPVIAFPCSGTKDCINSQNGIICSDFTYESLRNSILNALSIEYNSAIIRNNIIVNFTFEKMADEYIKLYNKILSTTN